MRTLLVVISEAVLEKRLADDARQFGAQGYTICDVRGAGMHRQRDAEWEGSRSIRMEVICSAEVADRLSRHILDRYCENYSISMYLAEVGVLRPEKF
ncbi:MAG TPA: transcriptional regulator [Usitatibacteraceae bacterium]|nr:transcriptional regulator [Usitatibacteraceae bacterium]